MLPTSKNVLCQKKIFFFLNYGTRQLKQYGRNLNGRETVLHQNWDDIVNKIRHYV